MGLLLSGAAAHLAAQAVRPVRAPRDTTRWRFTRGILPDLGGQMGLGVNLRFGLLAPDGAGPSAITGAVGADLHAGTTGSRSAALVLLAPALHRDWHLLALVRAERLMRTPYFGPHNEGRADDSLQDQNGPLYYRYALLRTTGFITIQRRVAGPVWLYLGGQARYYRATAHRPSPTLYGLDFGAASDSTRWLGLEGRAGMLVDTRDDWVAPRRGLLLEAIVSAGRLTRHDNDSTTPYRRWLVGAREFLTLDDSARTVLALRQRLSMAGDTLPYFLAYEQLTSWAPEDGVASPQLMRLHGIGNQLASNTVTVSVELRRKLLDSTEEPKQAKGLWGLVFGDGSVLWEPHTSASLRRSAWTIGAGLRLQTGRHSLLGLDLGWADTGPSATVTSSFGF